MTTSFSSPMDANDYHLRTLLDQRNARVDRHGRFPSLSEFSDSPSVYSHPYFTPRPQDRRDGDDMSDSFVLEIPPPSIAEPRSPYSHRERLNDPTASSLDLDDETSIGGSSNTCGEGDNRTAQDSDADSEHRLSLLGPKMRFHSRAPWETGEDIREEGNESDRSSKSGIFGKKNRTKSSRGEVIIRAFGRATSTARPSGESVRSQAKQKSSFEITAGNYSSSRGALYTLAHESLSSSSLTPSPSSSVGPSMARQNFSLPRTAASHSFTNYTQTSPSSQGTNSSPSSDIPRPYARTRTPSSPHSSHKSKRPSNDDFVHPYANPDLVVSYIPERFPCSPSRSVFGQMSRSESNATVTDTMSSRSAAISITPDTSAASLVSKTREQAPPSSNRIQGKEISAPVSVNNPILRANDLNSLRINQDHDTKLLGPGGPNGFQRWIDHPTSPTVTLISLQEAQALARERSRSATVNDPASSNATLTHLAFPESQENSNSHESNSSGASQSPQGGTSRARGRSISAGARARNALHSMVGAPQQVESTSGQTGPRALKHKKSGFMRIFNGREKEKTTPPPVPALSDVYSETNVSYQHIPKTPKLPLSRVPVPSLSPSLLQDSNGGTSLQDVLASQDILEVSQAEHSIKQNPSPQRKHTPPPLSIVTGGTGARSLASAQPPPQPRITPTASAIFAPTPQSPQSAPPGTTDFQALKLRPVSTTFSAHFTDIVQADSESPTDMESESPSSLGTAMSPMTPGSALRSDGKASVTVTPGDQSVVIQALQDQIISAKKAWQRQIWELEGQVRDLKAEVEDLRSTEGRDYCEVCGRGSMHTDHDDRGSRESSKELDAKKGGGVVNRPRARTGDAARFGSGY